jgi:Na+/melibiose symporter-like transporter
MDNNKDRAFELVSAIALNFVSAMIMALIIDYNFLHLPNNKGGLFFLLILFVAFIGIIIGRIYIGILLILSKPIDKIFKTELNDNIQNNAASLGSMWIIAPFSLTFLLLALLFSWFYSSMYKDIK